MLRARAQKHAAQGFTHDDEPLSLRRAQEELDSRYLLNLADAPWDLTDASLYPEAGACATCPRRTGSQPELFADMKATDTCTDPTCFTEKKNRVWKHGSAEHAMAYDEALASRIRELLRDRRNATERKMFDGLAFLVTGHMGCAIVGRDLVVRAGR